MAHEGSQERASHYLASTLKVLGYIAWPIAITLYYITSGIAFVLKLLYLPLGFLLQPLVFLGRFILACFLAPFQLLVRLETIYIYLGVAALVGVAIGLVVSFVYGSLSELIGPTTASGKPRLRSAKEYRESKRKQKAAAKIHVDSPEPVASPIRISRDELAPGHVGLSDGVRSGRLHKGLLSQAIMEETDSDL